MKHSLSRWLLALCLGATCPILAQTPTPTVVAPTPAPPTDFPSFGEWNLQIENIRVARGSQIELALKFKNRFRAPTGLDASVLDFVATDADGVGIRPLGNFYAPGGDPNQMPTRILRPISVASGEEVRVLALFEIPVGMAPLRTLTLFGRAKPLVLDITSLKLPQPGPAVVLPILGAVGANATARNAGIYAFKFEGARRGRNNAIQLFISTQNRDFKWQSHPGYGLDVSLVDSNGVTRPDVGNIFRTGGKSLDLTWIRHNIILVLNGTATICYVVNLPVGTVPKRAVVRWAGQTFGFDLPKIP